MLQCVAVCCSVLQCVAVLRCNLKQQLTLEYETDAEETEETDTEEIIGWLRPNMISRLLKIEVSFCKRAL